MGSNKDDWKDVPIDDWEDVSPTDNEPGYTESFARGAAQGATFGLADELAGAYEAPKGAFKTLQGLLGQDVSDDADVKAYEQERDASRAAFKAAEEANPTTSMLGNLTGGVATAFVPGLGAGKVLQGAGSLAKVGNAAKVGAISGGVAGIGASEVDLSEGSIGELTQDALLSAAMGAGIGATLTGGVEGVKGAYRGVKELTRGSGIAKGFDQGMKGRNVLTEGGREAVQKEATEVGEELGKNVQSVYEDVQTRYGKTLAEDANIEFDASKAVESLKQEIERLKKSSKPGADESAAKMQTYLDNLLLGKESETTVLQKVGDSAEEKLIDKMAKLNQNSRLTGENIQRQIVKGSEEGRDLLSLLSTKDELVGPSSVLSKVDEDFTLLPAETPTVSSAKAETVLNKPAQFVEETQRYRSGGVAPDKMTVSQGREVKEVLEGWGDNLPSNIQSLNESGAQRLATEQGKVVGNLVESASPNLSQANKDWTDLQQAMKSLGIKMESGPQGSYDRDTATGLIKFSDDTLQDVRGTIDRMTGGSLKASGIKDVLTNAYDKLGRISEKADKGLVGKMEDIAESELLRKKVQTFNLQSPASYVRAGLPATGNIVGLTTRKLSQATPEKLKDLGAALFKKGQQALALGDKGADAYMKVVNIVNDAATKDSVGRNALIFSAMQNPVYREILNSAHSEEQEEE